MTQAMVGGLSLDDVDMVLAMAEAQIGHAETVVDAVGIVRRFRRGLSGARVEIEAEQILTAAAEGTAFDG